jgi:hypothetical protein
MIKKLEPSYRAILITNKALTNDTKAYTAQQAKLVLKDGIESGIKPG